MLRSSAYGNGTLEAGSHAARAPRGEHRRHERSEGGPEGGVALLERPRGDYGELDFAPDPAITAHDVRAALGEDTDTLLAQADVEVDELIRLINAETTMLPPIRVLEESTAAQDEERSAAEPADEPARATVFGADMRTWKKRFLKGAALSVLITLTGGGAAALAMDKNVTVEVDGQQRTVHSFGDTVGEVLDDLGLEVGAHDALSPSPQAGVGDGAVIHLERGRHLNLVVDGVERDAWVRATTVGDALGQLGMDDMLTGDRAELSAPAGGEVPLEGMTLQVKTLKNVTLFNGGKAPKELTTHAVTTGELLEQRELTLGADDEVLEGMDSKLADGAEVHITRTGVTVVKEKETVEPPVKEIEDSDMLEGERAVEDQGEPGKELVSYEITLRNDQEVARDEISSKTLEKPEPKVVRVGTKQPPQPEISDGAVWDRLAQCESGGDWHINSGNGFYGGVQFDKSTWDAYGGDEYAAYPHKASRAEQIAVATKVRDSRGGYGAWPACSSKLGLPQ